MLSPSDPLALELERQLKLIKEGSIHIVRSSGRGGYTPFYSVVFAPYLGSGEAIPSPRLQGEAELRSFLERRLGIQSYAVDQALNELKQKGNTSILNVRLSLRQAKKLNLAERR